MSQGSKKSESNMGGEEEREEKDQSIISRSFLMYFIVPLMLLSIVPLYGEYKIQSGAAVIPQIQKEKPQKIFSTANDNEDDDINAYYDEEERIAEAEEKLHAERRKQRQKLLERQPQHQQNTKKQGRQNDPRRTFFNERIQKAREHYKKNFKDPIATALLADELRNRDMTILGKYPISFLIFLIIFCILVCIYLVLC